MLYDPKWEVKADPFTLESVIAWLEKQPAGKQYNYWNCHGECLYGQYMNFVGVSWKEATNPDGPHGSFMCEVHGIARSLNVTTFGVALKRARALTPR